MKNLILIFAAMLFFDAASARADDIVVLERTATDFDTWGASPDGRGRVLTSISRQTGVPIGTLEAQREQTRLGYGGLFIANSLASATGKTFDEIAALKASGHGWGWIAKQNNVKLGPIVSRAHRANKEFRKDNPKVKKAKKDKSADFFNDGVDRSGHGNGHGKGHGANAGHGSGHGKAQGMGHGGGQGKGKGKGR